MVAGKPPALIFVVRHGARLDAADKEWHLTSPTPYDPPLTYGGWTQCRALGARIASILLAREAAHMNDQVLADDLKKTNVKRKKHRVILHSSPFLRCTQTSIAIAAGMSQFHGTQNEIRAQQRNDQNRLPARSRAHQRRESGLETIHDNEHDVSDLAPLQCLPIKPFPKTKLRVDAFLGEWFSPEYYEHITHPPNSVLMLAGAKAELLHRAEFVEGEDDHLDIPKPNFFPGGWGSPSAQPGTPEIDAKSKELQLPELDKMTISRSPTRERATTFSSAVDSRRKATPVVRSSLGGYTPPNPRWAILPTDPIPKGYTAHAREACVDVDYAWDSTRPPQNWGDGGEYGEEWSSMHKRFRSGISRMVNWYSLHHESGLQMHGHKKALHPVQEEDTDEDCEIDTVLILVTHGAGCNALIGALTDQPVLMDVAMASLTMAMRKDFIPGAGDNNKNPNLSITPVPITRFMDNRPLSQEYRVLITASIDHLRTGSNPLSIPILQNPALAYNSLFSDRNFSHGSTPYIPPARYKMNRSTMITSSPIDASPREIPRSAGMMYAGVHRSASAAARSGGSGHPGLWGGIDARRSSVQLPAYPNGKQAQDTAETAKVSVSTAQADGNVQQKATDETRATAVTWQAPAATEPPTTAPGLWPPKETGHLVHSSPGLWSARISSNIPSGPPNAIPLEVSERSAAAKRRWTVNEKRGE